jgi:hypothetical protein
VTVDDHARQRALPLEALLRHAIDYAGLFPPAQLDMAGAVAEYESYLASPDEWALGRFVVPATRLDELGAVVAEAGRPGGRSLGGPRWGLRLSVVLGADLAVDLERVQAFDAAQRPEEDSWWGKVEAVELRAGTPDAVMRALRVVPDQFERYVEIPVGDDPVPLVRLIRDADAFAKVRTGGTTADAFPASENLARFLAACVREQVPFKATAGLHHPLRGEYPLTYEPGSACGHMYGFLNVFLATSLLSAGVDEGEARRLLEEHDPRAVHFDQLTAAWQGHRIPLDRLLASRNLLKSFGSCSFREPIDDLTALGLLPP